MRNYGLNIALVAAATVLAGLSPGAAWADQLIMKNGDRVTGSVVKQDGKSVTIKTANFGVITAPWEQVASIQSDQSVHVVLQDGRTLEGALSTADGKVDVATSSGKVEVTPGAVTAIRNADEQKAYERLLNPGLLELWTGTVNVGLAGTAGNARTLTFTTAFNAARTTNSDKASVYFNLIKASATIGGKSDETAQAVRGGWGYDRNVGSRLFVNTFNDYEYDKFQNLDLRFVIGGGLGFKAVKSDRATLGVVGGADYNHASFNTPLTRNSAEAYWGDDYSLKLAGPSSLIQTFRMFHRLSDSGARRMNVDLGISTKLKRWLNWTVSLSDRYLSDPAPGRKTNDFLYTTGLGLTFSR